jgi:hypothetical protein
LGFAQVAALPMTITEAPRSAATSTKAPGIWAELMGPTPSSRNRRTARATKASAGGFHPADPAQ